MRKNYFAPSIEINPVQDGGWCVLLCLGLPTLRTAWLSKAFRWEPSPPPPLDYRDIGCVFDTKEEAEEALATNLLIEG